MKWKHIVIRKTRRYKNKTLHHYDIHEVYMTDKGKIQSWTVEPVDCNGLESVKDLQVSLAMMLRDALESPVFEIIKGKLVMRGKK